MVKRWQNLAIWKIMYTLLYKKYTIKFLKENNMNLNEILNGFRVSHHFLKGLFCNSKGEYNL